MFQDKNKNKNKNKKPSQTIERNIVGQATEIKGEISSQGDFRIDGTVEGNINILGKLVIGKNAKVTGEVECANADIEGYYLGNLKCKGVLNIKSSATIDGEIFIEKLAIEPGAIFNAVCHMKGVKTIKEDVSTQKSKREIS